MVIKVFIRRPVNPGQEATYEFILTPQADQRAVSSAVVCEFIELADHGQFLRDDSGTILLSVAGQAPMDAKTVYEHSFFARNGFKISVG